MYPESLNEPSLAFSLFRELKSWIANPPDNSGNGEGEARVQSRSSSLHSNGGKTKKTDRKYPLASVTKKYLSISTILKETLGCTKAILSRHSFTECKILFGLQEYICKPKPIRSENSSRNTVCKSTTVFCLNCKKLEVLGEHLLPSNWLVVK